MARDPKLASPSAFRGLLVIGLALLAAGTRHVILFALGAIYAVVWTAQEAPSRTKTSRGSGDTAGAALITLSLSSRLAYLTMVVFLAIGVAASLDLQ